MDVAGHSITLPHLLQMILKLRHLSFGKVHREISYTEMRRRKRSKTQILLQLISVARSAPNDECQPQLEGITMCSVRDPQLGSELVWK